jgi:hypothetical protein
MMSTEETTTEARQPSELVIEAIAAHADVDPLEFDVPLGEVIDPDALDALFAPQFETERRSGRVAFTYGEYEVTVVSGSEGVSVDVSAVDPGADPSVGTQEA